MTDYPGTAVIFRTDEDLVSVAQTIRESTNIPYLLVTIPAVAAYIKEHKQEIQPSVIDDIHELLHEKLLSTSRPPDLSSIVDLLRSALQSCSP